ncbi:NACHT, LRR and PYD domains-containing protein 3-like [Hypanus sabinus]|uniref:NACHT, LRR and PYD domains-containing protein 3-like n=1 Tax=Hypanus sabinus TaxID=79690 RepID=UPI0028C4CDAE|nr:NACHT, LRR and PYD domains-containing protein 3-like [Hypanus sabinus]
MDTLRKQSDTLRVCNVLRSAEAGAFQLADRYVELTMTSTVRDRRLVEHELLARGRDHEERREEHLRTELEKIRIDQLFQSSFSRSKSKPGSSAAVAGVPGIGKTTMVQKIVHDWAMGKIYQQFQFVFRFRFRDLNTVNCIINLWNLILIFYPYLRNVLGELWKDPEKLLFIFDGLDEFKDKIDFADGRRDTEAQRNCTDPEFRCKVSDIVYSLIQRKLLPGCSVLVTTRPTALHLLEKADVGVWAEILGFDGEEREKYFHRCFEDQTVAAAVFKHVRENEILYTLSYNPSYCSILAQALGPFFTQRGRDLRRVPRTITQVYSFYISNILKNHSRKIENPRDVLLRVGQMAFRGVLEQKIVFTDGDLISYDLRNSQFLSGFLGELLERQDSAHCVVYTFPHLTVQEFVAALGQFLTPGPGDALKHLAEADEATDGRFEIFLRFVAGFTFPDSAEPLEEIVGPLPQQTTCQVTGWVKEKAARQIEKAKGDSGNRGLLNAMHYLFESQNRELVQATMGSVVKLSFSYLRLSPNDCAVLSHIITFCGVIKSLNLQNCHILCEGFQQLGPGLQKCQELRLAERPLENSQMKQLSAALKKPGCKMQKMRLDSNSLTASSSEDLVTVVSTIRSLTELELGYNKLGDAGVRRLLRATLSHPKCKIQKLGNLSTSALNITKDLACTAICGQEPHRTITLWLLAALLRGPAWCSEAVRSGPGRARYRRHSPHARSVSAFQYSTVFHEIPAPPSELQRGQAQNLQTHSDPRLTRRVPPVSVVCCASRSGAVRVRSKGEGGSGKRWKDIDIASALSTNRSLKTLNLGSNELRDSGIKLVAEALRRPNCKIQTLGLWAVGLTASCADDLVSTLTTNDSLTELELGFNDLGDSGVERLCSALRKPQCRLQELGLDNNGLTVSCVKELASALRMNTSLLRLNLGFNHLGNSGVNLLWEALDVRECKLQELRLRAVGLTDSCAEDLLSIFDSNTSLKSLDLNSNAFTDRSIPALRRLILNRNSLEHIQLVGNKFTSGGETQLRLLQGIRNRLSVFV